MKAKPFTLGTPAPVASCGGIGTPPAATWKGPLPLDPTAPSSAKAKTTAKQINSTAPGQPFGSPPTHGPLLHPMKKTVSGTPSQRAPITSSDARPSTQCSIKICSVPEPLPNGIRKRGERRRFRNNEPYGSTSASTKHRKLDALKLL